MPFPFVAAAMGLGSAFNFITGLSNSKQQAAASRYNTDATIKANKDAANLAYQRDLEQWHRANAYGTPAQQMQRLKAAGLNPMLAYGTGSPAPAPSPSMGTPEQNYNYQPAQIPQLDQMGLAGGIQNLQLNQAQIDNVKAQTKATEARTALDVLDATLKEIDKEYYRPFKETGLSQERTKAKYLETEKFMELLLKNSQKDIVQQQYAQSGQLFSHQLDLAKGNVKLQEQNIKETIKRIENLGFAGLQTKAQTKLTDTQERLTEKQIGISDQQRLMLAAQTKNEETRNLILNEERFQKEWENYLRKKGMNPNENPMQFGTRLFAAFLSDLGISGLTYNRNAPKK